MTEKVPRRVISKVDVVGVSLKAHNYKQEQVSTRLTTSEGPKEPHGPVSLSPTITLKGGGRETKRAEAAAASGHRANA